MNSNLKSDFDFKIIHYRTDLGGKISLKRIFDLVSQIKKIKPDIVHFTGLQLSGFHIAVACKLAGVKNNILTIRGTSWDMLEFNPIKKILVSFIFEPLTMILCSKFYSNSKYTSSKFLMKLFNYKSLGWIYNFPPVEDFSKPLISYRKEWKLSKTDVIAVSVGRINREKGYHVLAKSISRLSDKKNLKFIIVGDGTYLEEMKKILSNQYKSKQVLFLGYRSDINSILKESDFFILPTLHETLSVALLEASKNSLAMIGSDTGGVPEIIKHQKNGLLVPPGNDKVLTEAIEFLSMHHGTRKKFGEYAKKRVDKYFSNEKIENQLRQLYLNEYLK